MRYLIVETSWPLTALALDLARANRLVSRTMDPEDIRACLDVTHADILVCDDRAVTGGGTGLAALRDAYPQLSIAVIARAPAPHRVAQMLAAGADTVIDAAAPAAEVTARLLALARRRAGLATNIVEHGALTLDLETRTARLHGVRMALTPKVYAVLEYLALRPGQLVTREALLGHVYGLDPEPDSRVFDVYLCTLRAKLRDAGSGIRVETARGAGLRFATDDRPAAAAAA